MNSTDTANSEMTVRKAGLEEIASVEPLWLALYRHYASILPTLAGLPVRSADESWRRRCAMYEGWLADDEGFLVIVEIDDRMVAYAAVHIGVGLSVWQTGEHVGVWETMSVLPDMAGKGIGNAVVDAVLAELRERGITELMGKTTEGNVGGRDFFMHKGGVPINTVMLYRLPS
ncbi:MAG: GNAT family N-acetyltransferase [Solirubrobacteraceae bacterium]